MSTARALYIPPHVMAAALPWPAKLVLAEVIELHSVRGHCFATDPHFAERFDLSERTVRDAIRQLEAAGWVHREGRPRRVLTPLEPVDTAKSAGSDTAKSADSTGKICRINRQNLPVDTAKSAGSIKVAIKAAGKAAIETPAAAIAEPETAPSVDETAQQLAEVENELLAEKERTAALKAELAELQAASELVPPVAPAPTARPAARPARKGKPGPAPEDVTFETFWHHYPRKESKVAARAAFARLAPLDQLAAPYRAARWAAQHTRKVADGFCNLPTTWLNQARWTDAAEPQPVAAPVNPGNPQRPAVGGQFAARSAAMADADALRAAASNATPFTSSLGRKV